MTREKRTNPCPKCGSTSEFIECISNHWFDAEHEISEHVVMNGTIKHSVRCLECWIVYEDEFHK